jgi:hypothetical protein
MDGFGKGTASEGAEKRTISSRFEKGRGFKARRKPGRINAGFSR